MPRYLKSYLLTVLSVLPICRAVYSHGYAAGADDAWDTDEWYPGICEPLSRWELLRSVFVSTDRYIKSLHKELE